MIQKEILQDYVALDIETTGLSPKLHKIIEVAAVRVRGGVMKETYQSFINPGRLLEEEVKQLTGISDEDLAYAPEAKEVIPLLVSFIGNDVLLGHRILFDYSFVKKAAVNLQIPFRKEGIDTLKISRKLLPDLESRRLSFLCQYFEIEHHPHRAMADAVATAMLYQKLCERVSDYRIFKPKELKYDVKKEQQATPYQKERLYKLVQKHKLVLEYDIDKLSKNEASRITDKIFLKHGR